MNLFTDYAAVLKAALAELTDAGTLPAGLSHANVTVEPPRDASHGDLATNAAMVLAKPAGLAPRVIADALAARLAADARVAVAEVAGPGFLNIRLKPAVWQSLMAEVLTLGAAFGKSNLGQGKRVNVEYVSANPTGPLHVGHTRGAVFGDALASLLDYAGWDVTREFYYNDAGAQIDNLTKSVHARCHNMDPSDPAFPEDGYRQESFRKKPHKDKDYHEFVLHISDQQRKNGKKQSKEDKKTEMESFIALRGSH